MASKVDLPTPEPAKMPMRCPAQSGVKKSMTRTPLFIGRRTRSRRMRGGRLRVDRLRALALASADPGRRPAAQRVDHAALPRTVRLQAHRPRAEGASPTPPSTRRVEDLTVTPLMSILTTSPGTPGRRHRGHDIAELEIARQPGDAIGGRPDFGDHAAHAHGIEPEIGLQTSRCRRSRAFINELPSLERARSRGRAQGLDRVVAIGFGALDARCWRSRNCAGP